MSPAPPKPATYEDLLALPENVVGQIIDGELDATFDGAGPIRARPFDAIEIEIP